MIYTNKLRMIEDRQDVFVLVDNFCDKIKKDNLLGPIFLKNIPVDDWSLHIEKLTDFWETNLFGVPGYKGNPTKKHVEVDEQVNFNLDQVHFGRWVYLWYETVDSLYGCSLSQRAKYMAKKIADAQLRVICNYRLKN